MKDEPIKAYLLFKNLVKVGVTADIQPRFTVYGLKHMTAWELLEKLSPTGVEFIIKKDQE